MQIEYKCMYVLFNLYQPKTTPNVTIPSDCHSNQRTRGAELSVASFNVNFGQSCVHKTHNLKDRKPGRLVALADRVRTPLPDVS